MFYLSLICHSLSSDLKCHLAFVHLISADGSFLVELGLIWCGFCKFTRMIRCCSCLFCLWLSTSTRRNNWPNKLFNLDLYTTHFCLLSHHSSSPLVFPFMNCKFLLGYLWASYINNSYIVCCLINHTYVQKIIWSLLLGEEFRSVCVLNHKELSEAANHHFLLILFINSIFRLPSHFITISSWKGKNGMLYAGITLEKKIKLLHFTLKMYPLAVWFVRFLNLLGLSLGHMF